MNKDTVATREQLGKSKVRMEIWFTKCGSSKWDFFDLPIAKANDASGETKIFATLKTGKEVLYSGFWIGEVYYMRPLFNSNGKLILLHRTDYAKLLRKAPHINHDLMPAKNFSPAMVNEYLEDELETIMHRQG